MNAILQDDGSLLIPAPVPAPPLGGSNDPRYAKLLAGSVAQ